MKFQYIKDKVSAYFTKGNERSVAVKKKYRRFISVEMYKYFSFLAGRSIDHRLC